MCCAVAVFSWPLLPYVISAFPSNATAADHLSQQEWFAGSSGAVSLAQEFDATESTFHQFGSMNPLFALHSAVHDVVMFAKRPRKHVRLSGRTIAEQREKAYYDIDEFFQSGAVFDWAVFGFASIIFWLVRSNKFNLLYRPGLIGALLLWVLLGCAFNAIWYLRWGADLGVLWFDGFVMELVFSMENAVFFLALAETFAVPVHAMHKVLVTVVVWQNLYDLVLYLGLANFLDKLAFLPYVLGLWLLLAGLSSLNECLHKLRTLPSIFSDRSSWTGEEEPLVKVSNRRSSWMHFGARQTADQAAMDSLPVVIFRRICGERFTEDYDPEDPCLLMVRQPISLKWQVTTLFLVAVMTILADCLLVVDVTLTKIENLQHPFVCFTSSALASFAMPELFYVTWKLSCRCPLVNVGISFILIGFGTQMLLSNWIEIGPLDDCGIMVVELLGCVIISEVGAMLFSAKRSLAGQTVKSALSA